MKHSFFKELSNSLRRDPEVRSTYESKIILEMSSPIRAVPRSSSDWEIVDSPRRLARSYLFQDTKTLRDFVNELLIYEEKQQHSAQISIDHHEVIIEVFTKDLNCVTELDYEYAKVADMIYQDVGYYK